MKQKIGFWVESQEDPANTAHAASENPIIPPRKSLVQVCFPQRGTNLSYFNDRFDLHVGDIVYVDGKLEGLRGYTHAFTREHKHKRTHQYTHI